MRLLKFYAAWCGPCREQTKIIENSDIDFVESIDVDDEESEPIVEKYKVRNLPTLILLDSSDNIVKRFTGLTTIANIKEALNNYDEEQSTDK